MDAHVRLLRRHTNRTRSRHRDGGLHVRQQPHTPTESDSALSPLVLLGSLGTLVSTISILPHLAHAVRNHKPQGSAFAWLFGAFSSGIWLVYGFAIGDMLIAAPGFITVPAGVFLGAWCHHETRRTEFSVVPLPAAYVPDEWDTFLASATAGDTLEMPRIVI